nr:MerR family transcriptional regulator [uncultured Romboutsia sp.]
MKLSIGQVSKLYDISKDTLRYYDKIGLLKPEVNEENGYRYYSYKHLDQLSLILWTKYLGISLSNIKETIESEDIKEYSNLVKKQQNIITEKINKLKNLKNHLKETSKILDEIINYKNEYDFDKIEIKNENNIFYGINVKKALNENLYIDYIKEIEKANEVEYEEKYFTYIINILDDGTIIENEDIIFIKEDEFNKEAIQKYLNKENYNIVKKEVNENVGRIRFWGTINELNDYLKSMNKYFKNKNISIDKDIFIKYDFYLPKKIDNEKYFSEIIIKIK